MTPAERGERAARVCSCKSCRPRLAKVVEAEIREAVAPLVEALRASSNVLRDYIPTIEANGASLFHGRSVLSQIEEESAKWA